MCLRTALAFLSLFASLGARAAEVPEEEAPPEVTTAEGKATDKACMCPCECVGELAAAPFDSAELEAALQETKRNFRWTPYAAPGYSPEVGGLLSAGALFSWSLDPSKAKVPRSSISVALSFSTTGAILATVLPSFYLKNDRVRINGKLYFKDMSDNYWGVGFAEGADTAQGADTTAYDRLWWQIAPRVAYQVKPHLFVGGLFDFNQTIATDLNPKMAADPDVLEDGTNNYNGGIGALFQYDTRDLPQSSFEGVLFEATVTGYGPWLGSNNLYMLVTLDYRHHVPIGKRAGQTVAWNIHAAGAVGKAPWSDLPMVGSPFDLRGYYWGRFRDPFATFALLEYRLMFPTKREGRPYSRSGLVAWGGIGYLGGDFLEASLLPNVGLGYRFEVQPRMNLRVDFGFGAYNSTGFYINFLEAF